MKRMICLILLVSCLLTCVSGVTAVRPVAEGQVTGHGAPTGLAVPATLPTQGDLTTSEKGLTFIKEHEGYSATPYADNTQSSIGYGCSTTYAEKYGFSTTYLTQQEAHDLLVCVVWELESVLDAFYLSNLIGLNQAQYDALMSFSFNLSTNWTNGCRLSRALISDTYTVNGFASAMGIWCHVGTQIVDGLVSRRIDEILLFLYGAYDSGDTDARFCTLRYTGTGTFENDIDFFLAGEPYGAFSVVTPPESGLYFAGWYADGVRITEQTLVARDLTVTVSWSTTPVTQGYEILALTLRSGTEQELTQLPEDGFYAEVQVRRGQDTPDAVVLLAAYSDDGRLLETSYLRAAVPEGVTYSLGTWFENPDGSIGSVKAFVLTSLTGGTPLCESASVS